MLRELPELDSGLVQSVIWERAVKFYKYHFQGISNADFYFFKCNGVNIMVHLIIFDSHVIMAML